MQSHFPSTPVVCVHGVTVVRQVIWCCARSGVVFSVPTEGASTSVRDGWTQKGDGFSSLAGLKSELPSRVESRQASGQHIGSCRILQLRIRRMYAGLWEAKLILWRWVCSECGEQRMAKRGTVRLTTGLICQYTANKYLNSIYGSYRWGTTCGDNKQVRVS